MQLRAMRTIAAVVAMLAAAAHADILVGQTVGVTGAVAATVKESMRGAQLYIDRVNAQGGIQGEKVDILTLDDGFDVKRAVENTRVLIEEKNVIAMFMNRGTPHTEAMMPLLQKDDVALVAPSTGATVLHTPVKRQIFNVRSSYQREAEKAVEHLSTLGMTRVAIVHVDDSFGRDGLDGAQKGFAKVNLKPVVVVAFDRTKPDYGKTVPPLVAADAQAVIWIGSGTAVSDGIKALRRAGSAAQVITLSNNASAGFVKALGEDSRGVILTQVFPSERSVSYPLVKEAMDAAREKGVELSPAMLEGYAAAKVLVEGLRRASPKPTRAKLIAALEKMDRFDLGGLVVGYSPTDHTGLDFADLSIIGSDGKFKR
jgi:branched-chain amino acid transport system substrate-binding protein